MYIEKLYYHGSMFVIKAFHIIIGTLIGLEYNTRVDPECEASRCSGVNNIF